MDGMALAECGRYQVKCIKHWLKLLFLPTHRYPKQCYLMLKRLSDNGRSTWTAAVSSLLFSYGLGYVWIAQKIGDANRFLQVFNARVRNIASQNMMHMISISHKADSYKQFKSLLNVERYLSLDICFKFKRALAKFRCSNHSLLIETGRHVGLSREVRSCPLCLRCNIQVVETEFHSLFECQAYEELRRVFLPGEYLRNRNIDSFISLLSLEDDNVLRNLAKFIFYADSERGSVINA